MIEKIFEGKDGKATSVFECLEVISSACQLVALQQDLNQVTHVLGITCSVSARRWEVVPTAAM